ncbi:dTDP-4-amino-4,6-dideoxygalactose transaminase [Rufibacter latericius]|uniref:dTDP-4-amino-4,6-dideoxygalactose transaminase n=2 Tax=Rufibacter latericius TaxID=2487040 RepID=A0A3M9MJM0_9BACT|nr:dTDP-4-amino-4,6-dideoxygalactose transaminase [Rufibacter latericius]
MIPFNKPLVVGAEMKYLEEVFVKAKFCGDGEFTKRSHEWLEQKTGAKRALLTTSCTHAIEMAAILAEVQSGDEVIMPSFTFVSTANPFVLRGAKIVFVDVRPDTMNIDETKIEAAITAKTKVIVPVHYAGVSCEMDVIMDIARRHNLLVIEDAAQGIGATYKGKPLGAIGHLGCLSFHETKNIQCGEGGALLINDDKFIERAEIIREKGTNRSRFLRGQVDKYTWVDVGSSYLPSELNAAVLLAQFENVEKVTARRLELWSNYKEMLSSLADEGKIELPTLPKGTGHNGHIFYLKVSNGEERDHLIAFLKEKGIQAVFHYVPLHSATAGGSFGLFSEVDLFTTKESERLLRLPMFFELEKEDQEKIAESIKRFFSRNEN